MTAEASLDHLLRRGLLWRGGEAAQNGNRVLASGFPELDRIIGGGWPEGALVELVSASNLGLSLLVPLLARLGAEPRWLAWVDPPWHPHAPALAARGIEVAHLLRVKSRNSEESLWAAEQLLRSGNCAVVLLWPSRIQAAQLRRLQLAAEQGDCLGVLFRPLQAGAEHSTAALRLRLEGDGAGLRVKVLKRRGGWSGGEAVVPCSG